MRALLGRVYPYFPVSLQNAGLSAFGYVYRRERFGTEFLPTLRAFEERDRWDPERMRQYTTAALREMLRHALDAPYYREEWERAGVNPRHLRDISVDSLGRLPLVRKKALRQNPMAFVPDRGKRVRGL